MCLTTYKIIDSFNYSALAISLYLQLEFSSIGNLYSVI